MLDPEAVAAVVRPEEPRQAEGLEGLLDVRVPELVQYQDEAYAAKYETFVREVEAIEQERTPGSTKIAESVARHLFKLMAYKDEYEVARLHLAALPSEGKFWFHLHPPVLRAMGIEAQDQARPLVRAVLPRCCGGDGRARRGHAVDPSATAEGRRGGARADRRVPRARVALVGRVGARHVPARPGDLRPAGRDPRLRGDQAPLGQAFPGLTSERLEKKLARAADAPAPPAAAA